MLIIRKAVWIQWQVCSDLYFPSMGSENSWRGLRFADQFRKL